uniref:BTB domain-containing protein n=1 Tax=Acrobeloides nanus TaxID=290746 RepID=A0A914CWG9_9BILA
MFENLDKELEVFKDEHLLAWIYTHLATSFDYPANEIINLLLLLEPDVSRWTFHPPTEAFTSPSDYNERERKIHILFLLTMEYFETRGKIVSFIINHLTLPNITDADFGFSHLVLKDLNQFLECIQKFPSLLEWSSRNRQSISSQLVLLRDCVASTSVAEVKPYDCMVFTYGSNKNLSLGNALGTHRTKPAIVETKEIVADDISFERVILGPSTTFLMASKQQNSVFVSGRLASTFYMTPEKFDFERRLVSAAIGSSHAFLCSNQGIYGIGDNAQNQMGFGARMKSLKEFTYLSLERTFDEIEDRIEACETSNNHSIILTGNGFFVAGSNVGQMGQYAERRYSQKSGPPEHFIRLLPPDNSFSRPTKGTVGMSLMDDATALYSGSRLWIFYGSQEMKPICDNSSLILSITACRPQFNECKLSVIIFTSDHKLHLWSECQPRKITQIEFSTPSELGIPRVNNVHVFSDISSRFNFSCGANGDFLFVQNSLLYEGKISAASRGVFNYTCNRVHSQPGFVNAVFMSHDGGNKALLVQKCRFHIENFNDYGISQGYKRIKENFEKYALSLWISSNSDPTARIKVISGNRNWKIHSFMLLVRCTVLNGLVHNGEINLKDYPDEVVGEMLQFIYTNKLVTRQLFDNWVRTKNRKRFGFRISAYSLRLKKLRQLAEKLKLEDLVSAIFNTNDYIEYIESLRNSGNGENVDEHSERETLYIKPVVLKSTHLNFPDGDTTIHCSDGELPFYRSVLKTRVAYFDALFRWHGLGCRINLDASKETASFFCIFLLNSDLKHLSLNFDQMVDLLVVADRYMLDDLIVHISEIIDKHLTIDRLAILISLLEKLHLPSIEAAVAAFCSINIALLVDNGLLMSLPRHLLDMIQMNLHCWASRNYDRVYENSHSFMNECLNIDLEKDIFNDYVRKARSILSTAGISLDQEPNEFLLAVNKARRIGRSRRKSSRLSTASLEEKIPLKNRESFSEPNDLEPPKVNLTPTITKPSNSWFKPTTSSQTVSLSDVMNQQSKEVVTQPKPIQKKETTPTRDNIQPKKLSWHTETLKPSAPLSISQIQREELTRSAESSNRPKANFKLIEVEERALGELQRFYEDLIGDADISFQIIRENLSVKS